MNIKKYIPKIVIILIQGGLGNQMFCYSFFLSLKEKYPNALYLFKISPYVNQHHGLEIFRIFDIKGKWRYRFCKPGFFWNLFHIIKQANALTYEPNAMIIKQPFTYLEGHWQSEKYFIGIKELLCKQFKFKQSLLNNETLHLSEEISKRNSVSVHIRRGDYLNFPQCAVCDINYYKRAIEYIFKVVQAPFFYIFSDDIEWCKQNIQTANTHFVNINQGMDCWQDMYLMSICKHNIIANSTFSWWGAWLNQNTDKTIIAPKKWFIDSNNGDIIPDSWVRI